MMLSNAQIFVRVQNIYNSENFDRSLRETAKFISEYSDKYKSLSGIDTAALATEAATLKKHWKMMQAEARKKMALKAGAKKPAAKKVTAKAAPAKKAVASKKARA